VACLNHRKKTLWWFHLVHHVDSIKTYQKILAFILWRSWSPFMKRCFSVLIGVSFSVVLLYGLVFQLSTLHHHSNLRLPTEFERIPTYLISTPRMHCLHRSALRTEGDSNYAVVFTFWDHLHRRFHSKTWNCQRTLESLVWQRSILRGSQASAIQEWSLTCHRTCKSQCSGKSFKPESTEEDTKKIATLSKLRRSLWKKINASTPASLRQKPYKEINAYKGSVYTWVW